MKDGHRIIGRKIERFTELNSTNDLAKKLAVGGAPEGTVVIAEIQKSGRGRCGRRWSSPPGGLWLSIILRPDTCSDRLSILPLAVGSAVANTLNRVYGTGACVKWPNDVLINDRKVAGVLTEFYDGGIVVGIGINVNVDLNALPVEVRETATTIKTELGGVVSMTVLIDRLLSELDDVYRQFNAGTAIINCDTLKKRVKIVTKKHEAIGVAESIDEAGALILRLQDGSAKRIISGDCIHLSAE